MKKRFKALYKRLKKNIQSPDIRMLPGQLAFFFLLTIVPIFALIIAISSNLNISDSFINSLVERQLPTEIVTIFKLVSNLNSAKMNNIIFFVSALVLASNGTYSLIVISNKVYKIKNRGFFYDRLKSLGMLLILILLFLFVMVVPVLGNYITKTINLVFHNDVSHHIRNLYNMLNLPLSWIFIFLSIKLLYIVSPDAKISRKHVNYGALFTSLSWVIFTKIYSMYLSSLLNFSTIYGSISNIIILLWWIYFLSYMYVMGIALNVSKYEEKEI